MTASASGAAGRTGMRAIRSAGLRRMRLRFRRFLSRPRKGRRAQREQANAKPLHYCIHDEKD